MTKPLGDITVIEVDSWMAAPSAAAVLADMGATVIKVEPPSGDPMRRTGRPPKIDDERIRDYDLSFDVDNRGKQSIGLALDTEQGQEILHKLIATADVFLCNLLPKRQVRFGLDPETLLSLRPGLVHATLTGYGTTGPEAWRPGYDVTAFFGRSGLYDAMREGDDGVVPMARPAQGDHTTGLALVGAILGALRVAERTGEGQVVETSLFETAVWTQATDYSITAVDRAPVRRRRRDQALIPTGNRYPCGDGRWVVFNMPEPEAWVRFCGVLEREDWLDDPRFADGKSRYRHMTELVAGIDEALAARSREEWGKRFDDAGLIWGPVQSLDETAADPQAHAIDLFPTIEHPERGTYASVRIPMRFHTADVEPRGPAPELGEHTFDLLTQLGFSETQIDEFNAGGVVRCRRSMGDD